MKNAELKAKDKKIFAVFHDNHYHRSSATPERVQYRSVYKAWLHDDHKYDVDRWNSGHHGTLQEGTTPDQVNRVDASARTFGRAVEWLEDKQDEQGNPIKVKRYAIVKPQEVVGEWAPIEKRWKHEIEDQERREKEEIERRRIDQINHDKAQEAYRIESEAIKESIDRILNKNVRLSTNLESVRKQDGTYARYTAVTISSFDLQRLIEMVYEARENAVA